ncbi:MAG: hypothetical protein JJ920_04670 [Roseitalea sp.]|jgi:hypothetical protein|nr:hypothetical protein [Roseitalea sp.]MBO6721333.1 hypothetical protein [Roseitalea sp.]MBO6742182.1 hypothetical protein [Roseitalea sp.]
METILADVTDLTCRCGQVGVHLQGAPILSVECLCSDCQSAGQAFVAKSGGGPVLLETGATPFVLYRKDRVSFTRGAESLCEHRLSETSKTRRVIASCCNTPVFLELGGSHWLSLYATLWPDGTKPPLQLRTMTKDAPADAVLSGDVPNPGTHTPGFYAKLLGAWMAMGFRNPKVEGLKERLDVW